MASKKNFSPIVLQILLGKNQIGGPQERTPQVARMRKLIFTRLLFYHDTKRIFAR
jgi:hypothetical protein